MNETIITETGCYLDNHRGHYLLRDAIELSVGYGFIIGPFERFALDMYEDWHHAIDLDALSELCDEAVEWLNSGQEDCPNCTGGVGPLDGEYWTHADDPDRIKRCKRCTGTGRGPRIEWQNFPPRIPAGHTWGWNDGDFGLYADEED